MIYGLAKGPWTTVPNRNVGWALPAILIIPAVHSCKRASGSGAIDPKSFWWHRHLAGASPRREACATNIKKPSRVRFTHHFAFSRSEAEAWERVEN
jgi:hypothetical protein